MTDKTLGTMTALYILLYSYCDEKYKNMTKILITKIFLERKVLHLFYQLSNRQCMILSVIITLTLCAKLAKACPADVFVNATHHFIRKIVVRGSSLTSTEDKAAGVQVSF